MMLLKNINTTMIYTHIVDRLENPVEIKLQEFLRMKRKELEQ